MAKKQQPVDIPPPSSSDEEETQSGSVSSSSDDEPSPQQQPPQSQKPQEQEPQSEEESDSDDETEGDDDDDDDDDDDNNEPVVKNPSLKEPQIEESDSDDDSDETQNSPSAFTIKPVVSKSPEPKTPTSKTTRVKSRAKRPAESEEIDKPSKPVSNNQEPSKPKVTKRPAETETEKIDKVSKNKKSKVSDGDGPSVGKVDKGSKGKKVMNGDAEGGEIEEKKPLIKWSEEDEIVLLDRIIDYKSETGADVNSKMDAFYEYVRDFLSVILTKVQLSDKIRRLKKKFLNNAEKWKNGEEPVFSKPHEQKLFELSQMIWGGEGTATEGNDSKAKSSKKKTSLKSVANTELFVQEEVKDTIIEDKIEETQDIWSLYPRLCASLESEASGYLKLRPMDLKEYVEGMINGFGKEKATELEEGWKAYHVMNHQLYAKRAQLISKQAEAVLDSLKHF